MNKEKLKIVVLSHGLTVAGGLSVGCNIVRCLNDSEYNIAYTFILPKIKPYCEIVFNSKHQVIWYENKQSVAGRWIFDNIKLPSLIEKINPDWILGLGNMGVPSVKINQAILFHKSQLTYPSKHSVREVLTKKIKNTLIKSALKRSLKYTKVVFCQTETAGKRFQREFDYHGHISTWPNAISSLLKNTGKVDDLPIPNRLKPWTKTNKSTIDFFVLARYYPHKNLELIVEACKHHRSKLKDSRFFITIDGSQHPLARKLLRDISDNSLEDTIINVGPLKQEELAAFYHHTDGLLLPTLLESFSGTYLEAMEFRRPIVTSNLDFAEELCGDAALYFDPWSTEDFVSTITLFCSDKDVRDTLVKNGVMQRSKYNHDWETTTRNAEKLLLEFNG